MKNLMDFDTFLYVEEKKKEEIDDSILEELLNEDMEIGEEILNESAIVISVLMYVGFAAAVLTLTKLILNIDKQIKIHKILNKETDPEKIKKLKEDLKKESYLEIELRNDLKKLSNKVDKEKLKAVKTQVDPKKVQKNKEKLQKLQAKMRMKEEYLKNAKADRKTYKKNIKRAVKYSDTASKAAKLRAGGDWKSE